MEIKKFKEMNSEWVGPVKILDILPGKSEIICTNLGKFVNESGSKATIGYSNILRISNNDIILDIGMSCVDLVIMVDTLSNYKVLSIKRGRPPFIGMWANPGGNIDEGEQPIDAAVRELEEETGLKIKKSDLTYVGYFDEPWRDPRSKYCISHAFAVILDDYKDVTAGDDATECSWIDVSYDGDISVDMAFDHKKMIKESILLISKKI